jgi:hypothetical protein
MGPKKQTRINGPAKCHPTRYALAKGLCAKCYRRKWWEEHPNYQRGGRKGPRMSTCHPERRHCAKGMCKPCYMRSWSKDASPTRHREYWARRGKDMRTKRRALAFGPQVARRLRRYGLTDAQVVRICTARCCDLCQRPLKAWRKTHVDHDHATGRFRGVLCAGCNTGLGHLGDTVAGLRRALKYLSRSKRA